MFENYKDWLFNDKIILKSQQRFKSNHHEMYTQEFNKIVLSSDDDKRLQTCDRITVYPHGTNVCDSVWKQNDDSKILICWKLRKLYILWWNNTTTTKIRDIDKIYLYAKDQYEAKYQFLINERESPGLKHFNDPKAFI